jgi:hypothetical protein
LYCYVTGWDYDVELVEVSRAPEMHQRDHALMMEESTERWNAAADGVRLAFTITPRRQRLPGMGDAADDAEATEATAAAISAAVARVNAAGDLHARAVSRKCGGESRRLGAVTAEARGACPTGRMGPKCDYVCQTSWRRTGSAHFHTDHNSQWDSVVSGALGSIDNPKEGEARAVVEALPSSDEHFAPAVPVDDDAALTQHEEPTAVDDEAHVNLQKARSFRALLTASPSAKTRHRGGDSSASTKNAKLGKWSGDGEDCSKAKASRGECVFNDASDPAINYDYVGHETNTIQESVNFRLSKCSSGGAAQVE